MKHIYTNGTYYYVEESEEECVKSFEYENDVKTQSTDWHQLEDNKQFNVMFRWDDDGDIDMGGIVLPENHYQEKTKRGYRCISWHPHYIMTLWYKTKEEAIVDADRIIEEFYESYYSEQD